MYKFRKALHSDLPKILMIIKECQEFLRTRGVDQWQDGYPSREAIEEDIVQSCGYILEHNGQIAAYAAIIYGIEESYLSISGGAWLSNFDYVTLHRLAVSSSFRGAGLGERFMIFMEQKANAKAIRSLRADTHRDNMVMQQLLTRMGFTLCGDIYQRGSHRLAFERVMGQ